MRNASMAGPAGMVVRSPKNSTSMPLPPMSRSHSNPTSFPARRVRSEHATGVGAERHDGETHGLALGDEPVVHGGRLERFGHARHGIALQRQPRPAPFPAADVRERHDHAVARFHAGHEMLPAALHHKAVGDDIGAEGREPSSFEPVPGVVQKRPSRRGTQLGIAHVRAHDTPEMAAYMALAFPLKLDSTDATTEAAAAATSSGSFCMTVPSPRYMR